MNHRLLPRYHRQTNHTVDKAINESTGAPNNTPPTTHQATLPGDSRRLRGIPAIGPTVTGATPGTIPHIHGIPPD